MSRQSPTTRHHHARCAAASGRIPRALGLWSLWLVVGAIIASAAEPRLRHGRRFDSGAEMTQRAAGAPEELERLAAYRGQWDVAYTAIAADGSESSASCRAVVTYVNRGHGYSELMHCAADAGLGHPLDTMTFIIYNPGNEVWARGQVDGYREMITLAQGGFTEDRLVLKDARRSQGGLLLVHERHTYSGLGASSTGRSTERFQVVTERSSDDGATWQRHRVLEYSRRAVEAGFMAPHSELGEPSPERAPETAEFDFLVGRWTSSHDMTLPTGRQIQWPSSSTAVHTLDGRAIMEFDWFDLDPSLPDAATTIVRIYNRAMRRWESLYVPNRGHSLLHFGGRKEGEEIVLHLFATGGPALSRFVFHNIEDDGFDWYSEQSPDFGATTSKQWVIRADRVVAEDEAQPGASSAGSAQR